MLIDTLDKLEAIKPDLLACTDPCVDVETTGLSIFGSASRERDHVIGVAIDTGREAYYLPLRHSGGSNLQTDWALPFLRAYLSDPHRTYLGYNYGYDLHMMERDLGIPMPDHFEDAMLALHLVNENEPSFKLKEVCDRLPNMTYIGQDSADLNVGGCTLRLFHGGDGNSYALSYRLQKLVESITGGKKPNIILAGHVHKFCYIFDRNIHAISVPAMQSQTAFMRARKLAAHTGFLILDFDTKDGNVCNLSVQLYPFYA